MACPALCESDVCAQRSRPRPGLACYLGKALGRESHTDRMQRRIDSDQGQRMLTWRFATVEPVFGNTRGNKRLDRLTLRGQKQVDGQWQRYCRVRHIKKLAHHGYTGCVSGHLN
jgi:hypothetical protein